MSISSIFSDSAAPTAPAPGVGPTLNAKDPVNDLVADAPAAAVSLSAQAKQLLGPSRGRNPRTTDPLAPSRGRNPRAADSSTPYRGRNPRAADSSTPNAPSDPSTVASAVTSAVTSAIAAYRQASVKPAP